MARHCITWYLTLKPQVHDNILNVDVTTVQCVFLLHVLWLFSGSHRDKIVLQHRRSSLATMCWDLIGKADKRRHSRQGELDNEAAWQAWITEESELRLATCVRVLECLSHIFLGTPLVFNLREATRQLPCPERLWRPRDASEWKLQQENSTGIVVVTGSRVHYMADNLFRTPTQARYVCRQGYSSRTIHRRQKLLPPNVHFATFAVVICLILELLSK